MADYFTISGIVAGYVDVVGIPRGAVFIIIYMLKSDEFLCENVEFLLKNDHVWIQKTQVPWLSSRTVGAGEFRI